MRRVNPAIRPFSASMIFGVWPSRTLTPTLRLALGQAYGSLVVRLD